MHVTLVRLTAAIFMLLSSPAWSAITIGDFALGAPKADVLRLLTSHFQSVRDVTGSRWQIEKHFTSATLPLELEPYTLGSIVIREINVFFNEEDKLREVEIKLNTVSLEDIKKLIPHVEQSQLEPVFRDTWEIFIDDGEIIYWVSELFESGSISFADKSTSTTNIEARRISNQKFKQLSNKLDNMINTLKKQRQ